MDELQNQLRIDFKSNVKLVVLLNGSIKSVVINR